MTDLLRWGSPGFPKRGSFWTNPGGRSDPGASRSRAAALAGAAAIGLGSSLWLGTAYIHYQHLAASEEAAAAQAQRANADLQDALAQLRDQLAAATQTLNLTQTRIAALSDEAKQERTVSEQAATSRSDRISQLSQALDQAQRELHRAEAQRVTLMARLNKAETDISDSQTRQQQVQAGLDQWQRKVQQLTADRDRTAAERDQLRARLGELQQKQSQTHMPARPLAAAPPAASPVPAQTAIAAPPPAAPAQAPTAAAAIPAPAQATAAAAPAPVAAPAPRQAAVVMPPPAQPTAPATVAVAHGSLAQVERVLASAGVDVAHLFAQYGVRTGAGGPFIPAPRGAQPATLSADQLTALSRLVTVLPVSAPLQSYELGSPFGVRGDPINGRSSFHTGIDMLAPYMTPVYATGPGVVSYSGYRDDYGKVVEIDHGNGISTRYAHLHRATVSVGQRVAAHTQIGFLGSTGRATGPHVHYEVLVNGEPQDPQKFLGLARVVAAAR